MTTTIEDFMADEYYEALGRQELIAEKLKAISEDGIRAYLGINGDAVAARIDHCRGQAKYLSDSGYPAASIVMCATAIELIVRFMLVRPLIQGAFLSDEWAQFLAERMTRGTALDRDMLPNVLQFRGIKINDVKLSNGADLWATVTGTVVRKRNRIVHQGETAKADDGKLALECTSMLWSDVVLPMAKGLGFKLDDGGQWHKIGDPDGYEYTPASPFKS